MLMGYFYKATHLDSSEDEEHLEREDGGHDWGMSSNLGWNSGIRQEYGCLKALGPPERTLRGRYFPRGAPSGGGEGGRDSHRHGGFT
jgi:hypothetical protein